MELKTSDIIFREDLYPRFEPSQKLIQQYAYSLEFLPPIKVNQNNILIDGYHRWKAHQLVNGASINVEIVETESEKEIKRLAYQWNSNHGLQLSSDEKRKYAVEMIGDMSSKELGILLSLDESTINKWTETKRQQLINERNREIINLYLRAWNTQKSIAEVFDIKQNTVHEIISNIKNTQIREIDNVLNPFLYNIWNLNHQDNSTESHFGAFPQLFMENLLWFHTQPLDIVYDPFAGAGTTIDACKKLFRRYYCTDMEVKPGREKDIKKRLLSEGIPSDLPKPQLVFLDPPYLLLAVNKYSDSDIDLGNMKPANFYAALHSFVGDLVKWKVQRIAYLIRPSWETNNGDWQWIDPMYEMVKLLSGKYDVESRYVLPYSTQQFNGLWVDRAKKANKCLILNRELTVFKVCDG